MKRYYRFSALLLLLILTTLCATSCKKEQSPQPHASPTATPTSAPSAQEIYQEYAFATDLMELVNEHCPDPVEYISEKYAPHWGAFTQVYGDVCFSTIPNGMRHLISYPTLDKNSVYIVASGSGKSYHSVSYCYTLLRTKEGNIRSITLQAAVSSGYSPCSKCVSPDATQ